MSSPLRETHIDNGVDVIDALGPVFEIIVKEKEIPNEQWFKYISMANLVYIDMARIATEDENLRAENLALRAARMGLELHSLVNKVVPPPSGKYEAELMNNRMLLELSVERLEERRREREETD